jgi:hypothetical protein
VSKRGCFSVLTSLLYTLGLQWNHTQLHSNDITAIGSVFRFAVEVIPVLDATQLALGTLYLQTRQCVCFSLYAEAVELLATMLYSTSSLTPFQCSSDDVEAESSGVQWCRSSLYIQKVFEQEEACQVRAECVRLCVYVCMCV